MENEFWMRTYGRRGCSIKCGSQQLKDEHGPLRAQMESFFIQAQEVGADNGVQNWKSAIEDLANVVSKFEAELGPHSDREDNTLFPMMANYIGREVGPIAVMEYEHEQAKFNLKKFMEAARGQLPEVLDTKQAKKIAAYAIQAYLILSDHFAKEENNIFPMAERMLTDDEKRALADAFKA